MFEYIHLRDVFFLFNDTLLLLVFAYMLRKVNYIYRHYRNTVENNTSMILLETIQNVLSGFELVSLCHRAFYISLQKKASRLVDNYENLKQLNFDLDFIKSKDLEVIVVGNGRMELERAYPHFPESFLALVNDVNQRNFNDFISSIENQFEKVKKEKSKSRLTKEDKLSIFKELMILNFRNNISEIKHLFDLHSFQINDEDYIRLHPELHILREQRGQIVSSFENFKTGVFEIKQVTTINKQALKQLLANEKCSISKVMQILRDAIKTNPQLVSSQDELTMVMSRYNRLKKDYKDGTIEKTYYDVGCSKIVESIIYFIDNTL